MGDRAGDRPKPLLSHTREDHPEATLIGRLLGDLGTVADRACIVVAPNGDRIRGSLGDTCAGIELHYVVQDDRRGVGDAVCWARKVVQGPFAVVMGDVYYHDPIAPSLRAWQRSAAPGAILVEPLGEASGEPMGLVRVEDGRIRDVRKSTDPAGWTHRVSGMFMLPQEAFETCHELETSPTGEIEVEAIVRALMDRGIRFDAIPYTGYRLNVNTPEELDQVRRMSREASSE